ncbi:MAG: hypothetical protein QXK57_03575 [Conexivisphaerales archaeon]
MIGKYKGQYTNAQFTIKERKMLLLVQIAGKNIKVVGTDRNIKLFRQSPSIQSEG